MEEQNKIYTLTHKQLVNELTAQEAVMLTEMLIDTNTFALYEKIKSDWSLTHNVVDNEFDHTQAYSNFLESTNQTKVQPIRESNSNKSKIISVNWRQISSAVAAIFILGLLAINLFNSDLTTHHYSDGAIVSLTDGSKVYLDHNSEITYSSNFKSREVTLKGKAIFEVSKNQGSTFIVNANDTKVTVLGTTFSVNANSNVKEIKVLEGIVKVEQKSQHIIIKDREGVIIDNVGTFNKQENISFSDESYYKPLLEFKNTPLPKVLSDLESKYNVSFLILGNKDISKCLFTSKSLESVNLTDVITILSTTFNASFTETEPSVYQVSRLSCN